MRQFSLISLAVILLTSCILLCLPESGFSITGRQVMEKSKKSNQSTTQVTEIDMLLIDKKGKEQQRAVKIWAFQGDEDKTLTRFTKPKSVSGVGFLVHSESGNAKRWLYLPKSKKTRMIPEGDKNKTFMGTDFTYYDLGPHDLDNEAFDAVKEKKVDGHLCYVVRGRSKTPETSLYGDVVKFVRKDNFVPILVDFFDKSGKLLKKSKVLDLKKISGNWTPMKVSMHNVQSNHKTIMTVTKVEYDVKIPDKTFSKTNLEKGR
jgi:outer membrane lipoprotein-sorting protein